MATKNKARIREQAADFNKLSDAYGNLPEGTRLPSGAIFSRGAQFISTDEDDRWVRQNYGGDKSVQSILKDDPTRPSAQATTDSGQASIQKTINRNDPLRPSAEQAQDLDAGLAGLGSQASPVPTLSPELQHAMVSNVDSETMAMMSKKWKEDAKFRALYNQALEVEARLKEEEKKEARRKRTAAPYIPQYYSGAQAQIYFDDVLIDEVVQIQYSTATNKMPIYGYASELFDTVASGNLLVQGSFVINFVEAGYLAIIAAAMLEKKFGVGGIGRKLPTETKKYAPGFMAHGAMSQSVFSMRDNSILTPGSYLSNQAINQVRGLGNKEFRELAREANINKLSQSNQFSGAPQGYASRFDLMAPFDIYAIFGDYTDPDADHTVRKLKNVHLTGQAQTIISSGEPVGEVYNFIARTIE